MRRPLRRRRAQILPLFFFMSLFMLGIAALLIDTAGIILVSEDFAALGWRSAHFAAAQLSAFCEANVANEPGQVCTVDSTVADAAKIKTTTSLQAYAAAWSEVSSRERTGLPVDLLPTFPQMSIGDDLRTVTVELRGCYTPFLLSRVIGSFRQDDAAADGCAWGQIYLTSTETASLVLSN